MSKKSFKDESRGNWSPHGGLWDDGLGYKRLEIGCLQRIADALERIANRLDCEATAEAARSLIRMDKRMAKSRPLGKGGRRK